MADVAPMPGSFMMTSIIGFFISALYVMNLSKTWGLAFCLVFVLMFIASFLSMSRGDVEIELAMDKKTFHRREN